MKFEPYPEDAEVHDTFATVPVDTSDHDDGDDSATPAAAPGLVRRIVSKVKPNGG